jgi:hypothetical protein
MGNIMMIGNIVKWHGRLYIVADVDDQESPTKCTLLASDCSNSRSYPTMTWPTDAEGNSTPEVNIHSVRVVADNLRDLLDKLVDNMLDSVTDSID